MSPIMGEQILRPGPERAWYVAQFRTGLEVRSEQRLAEKGIDAYVPHEVVWFSPPRQKRVRRRQPLLQGYVFVYLPDPEPPFSEVRKLEGFVTFLGALEPLPISADIVRDIHEAELAGRFDTTHKKHDRYQPGDRVKMLTGVGAGFVATVQEMTPEGRVALLWTLFGGKPTPIELDQDDIEQHTQDVEKRARATARG